MKYLMSLEENNEILKNNIYLKKLKQFSLVSIVSILLHSVSADILIFIKFIYLQCLILTNNMKVNIKFQNNV